MDGKKFAVVPDAEIHPQDRLPHQFSAAERDRSFPRVEVGVSDDRQDWTPEVGTRGVVVFSPDDLSSATHTSGLGPMKFQGTQGILGLSEAVSPDYMRVIAETKDNLDSGVLKTREAMFEFLTQRIIDLAAENNDFVDS